MMGDGMKGDFLVILGMFLYSFSFSVEMFMYSLYESESEVSQSCLTLCSPMDCSLPGSSIHRIFQAKVLEWVAIQGSSINICDTENYSVHFASCGKCTIDYLILGIILSPKILEKRQT